MKGGRVPGPAPEELESNAPGSCIAGGRNGRAGRQTEGGGQKGVVRKLTAPLAGCTHVWVGARRQGGREGVVNTLAALVGGSGSQTQLGRDGGRGPRTAVRLNHETVEG